MGGIMLNMTWKNDMSWLKFDRPFFMCFLVGKYQAILTPTKHVQFLPDLSSDAFCAHQATVLFAAAVSTTLQ